MKKRRGKVLCGWKYETLEGKIKYILSLPLEERYSQGLARGYLALLLERNQIRVYGKNGFKSIQVIKPKPR